MSGIAATGCITGSQLPLDPEITRFPQNLGKVTRNL
jgi:hypothetical protein